MAKERVNMSDEHWKKHKQMKGLIALILGLLIFANAYWSVASWPIFIGLILIIVGIIKLIIPMK